MLIKNARPFSEENIGIESVKIRDRQADESFLIKDFLIN